jgi:hypothetical protein
VRLSLTPRLQFSRQFLIMGSVVRVFQFRRSSRFYGRCCCEHVASG